MADFEKAGIPTILLGYTEETGKVRNDAVLRGIPHLRYIEASRSSLGGVTEAELVLPKLLDGLTRPLTDEEKEGGRWAPTEPRILFEGTLEEAEEFYNQYELISGLNNTPFSRYTDGLPVVIPTEERVEKMLEGTSHRPDEI